MIASLLSLTMILLAILLPMGLHIVHLSYVRVHRLRTYMMDPCMLLNSLNVPSLILIFGCKLILCGRKRINNTPMVCCHQATWSHEFESIHLSGLYSVTQLVAKNIDVLMQTAERRHFCPQADEKIKKHGDITRVNIRTVIT